MFFRIVWNQAIRKWAVTGLLLLAMTSLVTLYVYLRNTAGFTNRSMQIIVKEMGHNILLLPAEADPLDTHLCSDSQKRFGAETTRTLARHRRLASKYYVSVLQQRVDVGGRELVLTGIEPIDRGDETPEKRNMIDPVPPASRLGVAAAKALAVEVGDSIEVLGGSFRVCEVLTPRGQLEDYRIYVPLADAQRLLGAADEINAIWAFLCMHGKSLDGVLAYQDKQLAKIMPSIRQITRTNIARGRYLARATTQQYLYYLLGIVLGVTVIVIVITGLQEVSERRQEVGILVSMGAGYLRIVGQFVAKVLAVAVMASVAGFLIGAHLAVWLNSSFLVSNTAAVRVVWGNLPGVIGLTCLVALAAEVVPMARLVRLDPNTILMAE